MPHGAHGVDEPADRLDLASVYRAHHDTVWRCSRAFGVAPECVDDATQDVFVVVQRRLGDFDGRVPVRRWILGITRNVALKYRARSARRLSTVEPIEALEVPDPRGTGPEDATAQRQAADFVARFLETLDDDKRLVFVLADVEGTAVPEIAELVGSNINTVYTRLRAARQKFEQAVHRHRVAERRRSWSP